MTAGAPPAGGSADTIPGVGLVEQFSSLQMMLEAHRPGTVEDDAGSSSAPKSNATPVVLLAGFLGAGKTSLLIDLLTNPPPGTTIRAIVNDVGALAFDPSLIEHAGDLQVELTNGCACCQSSSEVGVALDAAAGCDLIVLEASGIADPVALSHVVDGRPTVKLDRVVTAVDATAFTRQLADSATGALAVRQLAAAHAVIVTKLDQIEAPDRDEILAFVAARAPGRPVASSMQGRLASGQLLPASQRGTHLPIDDRAVDHGILTMTCDQVSPITRAALDAAYGGRPASIARSKGVLIADDERVAVQSAGDTASGSFRVDTQASSREIGRDRDPGRVTLCGTNQADLIGFATLLGCI